MKRYKIVQVGLGTRGETAVKSYQACHERMELVGACDVDENRLKTVSARLDLEEDKCYTDAETMLRVCRPELFSFCTLPSVRLELIELAIRYGVRGILFEKPMATSLREAKKIVDLCRKNDVKAVVCHQHKYFDGFRALKKRIDTGEMGELQMITAECKPWFAQLGTHYIDYVMWAAGGRSPVSVVGHIHGRDMLEDSHPSPDYMLGELVFDDGLHATVQFGYFSRSHQKHREDYKKREFPVSFWEDDRLTVYGTTGYAWAECNGSWGAFTKATGGSVETGQGGAFHDELNDPKAQILFNEEFLDWMDDSRASDSCDVAVAYVGFETGIALIQSALEHRRVDLPLEDDFTEDEVALMRRLLPECERREFALR